MKIPRQKFVWLGSPFPKLSGSPKCLQPTVRGLRFSGLRFEFRGSGFAPPDFHPPPRFSQVGYFLRAATDIVMGSYRAVVGFFLCGLET